MSAWRLDDELGWQRNAACRTTTPSKPKIVRAQADRYFANHAPSVDIIRACKACPVREQCLEWALRTGEQGYWGGMSQTQRDRLRRGVA